MADLKGEPDPLPLLNARYYAMLDLLEVHDNPLPSAWGLGSEEYQRMLDWRNNPVSNPPYAAPVEGRVGSAQVAEEASHIPAVTSASSSHNMPYMFDIHSLDGQVQPNLRSAKRAQRSRQRAKAHRLKHKESLVTSVICGSHIGYEATSAYAADIEAPRSVVLQTESAPTSSAVPDHPQVRTQAFPDIAGVQSLIDAGFVEFRIGSLRQAEEDEVGWQDCSSIAESSHGQFSECMSDIL